jgi:hypothetical protein
MESSEKRSSLASSIQSQLLEERAEPHVQENPKQPPPTKLFGIPQYHTGYAGYHGIIISPALLEFIFLIFVGVQEHETLTMIPSTQTTIPQAKKLPTLLESG